MDSPSLFNDILGPVMRGPSSSHTAGSFHIAVLARALLGGTLSRARVMFDPAGSYARVFREQGVDRAFAAGLLGWPLDDERFPEALTWAGRSNLDVSFEVVPLARPDHPNAVEVELWGDGGADGLAPACERRFLSLRARSVGGGVVEVTRVGEWPVRLSGDTHVVLVVLSSRDGGDASDVVRLIEADGRPGDVPTPVVVDGEVGRLVLAARLGPLTAGCRSGLEALPGVRSVMEAPPLAFVKRGRPLFDSAGSLIALADEQGWSMGRAGLEYESVLLGWSTGQTQAEMARRFAIMRAAVRDGLQESARPMQLLRPTAGRIMDAESAGRLAVGGLHTRAAARAMAVMHVNGAMGVVCAAPTGGSAGVIPGVVVTLAEERGLDAESVSRALFAASVVGLVVARRATFAAEVAGCQVEIGAAGAMAAAAVVEAVGGTARQAADAAAIAFHNTMGMVCDLVQGVVEIPCHTRNALAAASAFVCADLVLGGYENPIGLDETIDAVLEVGRMMPAELRCTARGGLATTPSALAMRRRS